MPRSRVVTLATLAALFTLVLPLLLPTLTVQAQASSVRFDNAPCMFDLPDGAIDGKDVVCGYVTVLEVHANPTGPTIKLATAVFKSPATFKSGDAMMYLEGGPGGAVNDTVSSVYDVFTRDFMHDRDFIFFDQRGVGKSQPALDCPEEGVQYDADDTARVSYGTHIDHSIAATLRCRDRLVSSGVNLNAYHSSESAADVNDIRAALGYKTLSLIGVSYGTRLALTVMRDFPQLARAVVLDSSVPLEANLFEDDSKDFSEVLNAYFDACVRVARCNAKYPALRADFADLYVKLNANPIALPRMDRATGKPYTRLLSGDSLVGRAHSFLYASGGFFDLANFIEGIKAYLQNPTELTARAFIRDDSNGTGVYWSVYCAEEIPFNDYGKALANAQNVTFELREWSVEQVKAAQGVCFQWPAKPLGTIETQPVVSSIPSLVMTSADDVATPARYGRTVAQSLKKSYLVSFPAIGHSAIFNGEGCGVGIVFDFITNPTKRPSTSCTADL